MNCCCRKDCGCVCHKMHDAFINNKPIIFSTEKGRASLLIDGVEQIRSPIKKGDWTIDTPDGKPALVIGFNTRVKRIYLLYLDGKTDWFDTKNCYPHELTGECINLTDPYKRSKVQNITLEKYDIFPFYHYIKIWYTDDTYYNFPLFSTVHESVANFLEAIIGQNLLRKVKES